METRVQNQKREPGDAVVTFSQPRRLFNTMNINTRTFKPSDVKKIMESVMLTIDVEKADDVAVVHCAGRLVRGADVSTLRNAVVSEKTTRIVVLDLSQLEFIDGGGLNALVSLHHWTRNHGIQLKLVNPSDFVREVFTVTGLNRVFDISSLRDAIRVLHGADCHHSKYAAGYLNQPQVLAAK